MNRMLDQEPYTAAGPEPAAGPGPDREPEPEPGAELARLSRVNRRQRVLLVVALAAAAASGAGLVASTHVKSPAQRAAEAGAPRASVLTAQVARRVLTDSIVTRADVVAGTTQEITPTSAQGAVQLLVTGLRTAPGDTATAGRVLIEVSGRPVIALRGAVPAYRNLGPGDDGADVAELQDALRALGYSSGSDPHGHFGPGTKDMVSRLYQRLGYDVPTTGGPGDRADRSALDGAAQATVSAQRTVAADQSALSAAQQARAAARTGVPQAQQAVDQARTTLGYARDDLARAQQARADLVATTGVMMPENEFVFVPSFPVRVARINGGVGATVSAPLLTLQSGALIAHSVLQPGQQVLVKTGTKVQLSSETLGRTVSGTVTAIGAFSDTPAAGGQPTAGAGQAPAQAVAGYPVTITPDAPLPGSWSGQNVGLTISSAATAGPVLVVPESAISAGSDGQTSVTVLTPAGTRRRVAVEAGPTGDGSVAVDPVAPGALEQGDTVVVGVDNQGGAAVPTGGATP